MTDRLTEVIAQAIALGMAIYNRIHTPRRDIISKSQAIRYLRDNGYSNPDRYLTEWEESGSLKIRRPTDAKNGKTTISYAELLRCTLYERMKNL